MKDLLLERMPAHDLEAEAALISAVLINGRVVEEIPDLMPVDFYFGAHKKIFQAMKSLHRAEKPIDLVTVATWLKESGQLEEIGGAAFIATIADAAPIAMNTVAYADIIKDFSLNRQVLQVATEIQNKALSGESGVSVLESLQCEALKLQHTEKSDDIKLVRDIIGEHLDNIEKVQTQKSGRGYPLGFPGIDRSLIIMGPKFILIAGRPKMGKTSLAVTCIRNLDKLGIETGVLSIEMPGAEIIDKWIAMESGVDSMKLSRYKGLDPTEFELVNKAAATLSKSNIMIDESGSIGIDAVKRKCRKMVKDGAKVLFIDQLSQIKGKNGDDRFARFADNCNEIAQLKKELNVPIFLLVQLNRDLEKRKSKEPQPSDLKMTGNLEEDCDAAIFVYRPEIYATSDAEKATLKGIAIINLALNRHGSTWREKVSFKQELSYFYSGENTKNNENKSSQSNGFMPSLQ